MNTPRFIGEDREVENHLDFGDFHTAPDPIPGNIRPVIAIISGR